MTRLWWVTRTSKSRGLAVEALTDEQALARLERGESIRPMEGTRRLTEILLAETASFLPTQPNL